MSLGIPPLEIKIMLESNPLKSIMVVQGLAVSEVSMSPRENFVLAVLDPFLSLVADIAGQH